VPEPPAPQVAEPESTRVPLVPENCGQSPFTIEPEKVAMPAAARLDAPMPPFESGSIPATAADTLRLRAPKAG
jgi:hypothetical protein